MNLVNDLGKLLSFLSLSLDSRSEKWSYLCSTEKIKAVKTARCSGNEKRDKKEGLLPIEDP